MRLRLTRIVRTKIHDHRERMFPNRGLKSGEHLIDAFPDTGVNIGVVFRSERGGDIAAREERDRVADNLDGRGGVSLRDGNERDDDDCYERHDQSEQHDAMAGRVLLHPRLGGRLPHASMVPGRTLGHVPYGRGRDE
jgi:hypothetical protein